jgi:hypothetical protein
LAERLLILWHKQSVHGIICLIIRLDKQSVHGVICLVCRSAEQRYNLCHHYPFTIWLYYTIEDLKRHVFNLQMSGIGNDLKQSTPYGVRF